ncbi:MAG: hypothetical protein CM1200mP2_36990 [Planctomycetaceae bacterium]|nr:MAG: hypothetical protein CM1200mP2_36990 [Planctomycetaceae bacterium]
MTGPLRTGLLMSNWVAPIATGITITNSKGIDGGTLITDEVDYAPWGGHLMDRLLVRRDLRQAFRYRHDGLASIFPSETS